MPRTWRSGRSTPRCWLNPTKSEPRTVRLTRSSPRFGGGVLHRSSGAAAASFVTVPAGNLAGQRTARSVEAWSQLPGMAGPPGCPLETRRSWRVVPTGRFRAGCGEHVRDRSRQAGNVGTSRLSPHLHFGEVGPCQVADRLAWSGRDREEDPYLRQLGWREFSQYLLFHNPDLGTANLRRDFDRMPWRDSPADLRRWQQGQTGYPLVDAGMRELLATGWMHNRVRMVVASFLTKHLLIDWRSGAAWFWQTLVDADWQITVRLGNGWPVLAPMLLRTSGSSIR